MACIGVHLDDGAVQFELLPQQPRYSDLAVDVHLRRRERRSGSAGV